MDAGVVLAGREEAVDELRRLCRVGGTVTVVSEAPHEAIVAFIAAALVDAFGGPEPLYVESLDAARRLLAPGGAADSRSHVDLGGRVGGHRGSVGSCAAAVCGRACRR